MIRIMMKTPSNYSEMISLFGDIRPYIREDGTLDYRWEEKILDICYLPYPMRLSWAMSQMVTKMRCHRLLTGTFRDIFAEISDANLTSKCNIFGGCYQYRSQRGSKKLSTHAWAISIDIDPDHNPLGSIGVIEPMVIEIFEAHGFIWGGRFQERKDPMHFQHCLNY